jgi:phosphoglycolate phosphatase-like HAD superfamily hydrolase
VNDCYLFDIDGTLADCSHRLRHIEKSPKDWDAFFGACDGDAPIEHICDLARIVALELPIVFVSGRSDQCRDQTEEWLKQNRLWSGYLYMRKHGDHRPDDIIKLELLERLRGDGFNPIMAFDDRDRVVAAWRSAGVPCAQVAPGDF